MRLISYNILDGGEGRADPLAEVILAQTPDVVALVEADVPAVVDRLSRRLGMDAIVGPAADHAVALLSRWPIVRTVNHAVFDGRLTRGCLEAVVRSPAGQEWPIGVVHLPAQATDAAEDARLAQLAIVLERFAGHRAAGTPHVLCGDFNSNAPYQRIDPDRVTPKTRDAHRANGGRLPTRVIEAIAAAGYVDTYHARHDERGEMVGTFTTQHPGQRVDYLFTFGVTPERITDAWIEQDRLAKYASDHYPIAASIND